MSHCSYLIAACLAALALAQPLTLDEVLFRANEAVIAYERVLSSAVAEERTTQRLVSPDGRIVQERTVVAQLVLIRLPADEAWSGFREVVEVDGRSLAPGNGRLLELAAAGDEESLRKAGEITEASAKHYLREFWRTVNLPTIGLTFLHALNQHRFRFEKSVEERVAGVETWAIDYTEHSQPTLIRSDPVDIFTRGTLWIDPLTGRLARSRLVIGGQNMAFRSEITVNFRPDATLGVWLPAESTERHENLREQGSAGLVVETTYVNFRPLPADAESGR